MTKKRTPKVKDTKARPDMTRHRWYLKQWLQFSNLSQEYLVDAGVASKSQLSEVMKGDVRYNETMLQRIADALKVDPSDVLGVNPLAQPESLQELIKLWRELPRTDRLDLLALAKDRIERSKRQAS